MRFIKLLRYDLEQGFRRAWIRLLIIALVSVTSCILLSSKSGMYLEITGVEQKLTYMEYIFFLLGGNKKYIPNNLEGFEIPITWFLLHIAVMYGTLHFSYRDMDSLGGTILARSEKRISWWFSKCIWNVSYSLCAYLVIYAVISLYCWAKGGSFSLDLSGIVVNDYMKSGGYMDRFPKELSIMTIVLPLLVSICSGLLQMLLTLFMKPMFSFGVMAILMLSASYLRKDILYGSYSIMIRSRYVVEDGANSWVGLGMTMALIVVILVVGAVRFKKYDILRKG